MRYTAINYEDIDEEQVQKFFAIIKEILLELKNGNKRGRRYADFIKAGVTKETMYMLKAGHFLTWHNATDPVWLSWENNFYPDRTISNLYWEMEHHLGYNLSKLEMKTFDRLTS